MVSLREPNERKEEITGDFPNVSLEAFLSIRQGSEELLREQHSPALAQEVPWALLGPKVSHKKGSWEAGKPVGDRKL